MQRALYAIFALVLLVAAVLKAEALSSQAGLAAIDDWSEIWRAAGWVIVTLEFGFATWLLTGYRADLARRVTLCMLARVPWEIRLRNGVVEDASRPVDAL